MRRPLLLAFVLGAIATPAFAQSGPPLYPGDPYTFMDAYPDAESSDGCNARGATCTVTYGDLSAATQAKKMYIGSGLVAGLFGLTASATGRIANPFHLAPGPKHAITAKIFGTVRWRGWLQADVGAYDNTSSSEIAVTLYDNTDPAHRRVVVSQTLHSSSVSGTISTPPFPSFVRDIGSAGFNLVADIEPEHNYFVAVEATVTSNGGLLGLLVGNWYATQGSTIPALNDGFIEQSEMKLKLDPDYQDQIDKLQNQLAHHTHGYLTGRGTGQNNTDAVTTEPLDASPTTASDIPAGDDGALAASTVAPDHIELIARVPKDAESPRVERRLGDGEWSKLAEVPSSGIVVDRAVSAGTRYGYRLVTATGTSDELWIDVPVSIAFGLETLRPNPAFGVMKVTFALPSSAPATLTLYDVQGRMVLTREVGSFGLGRHSIEWSATSNLAPGVYMMRLGQEGRAVSSKVALVR